MPQRPRPVSSERVLAWTLLASSLAHVGVLSARVGGHPDQAQPLLPPVQVDVEVLSAAPVVTPPEEPEVMPPPTPEPLVSAKPVHRKQRVRERTVAPPSEPAPSPTPEPSAAAAKPEVVAAAPAAPSAPADAEVEKTPGCPTGVCLAAGTTSGVGRVGATGTSGTGASQGAATARSSNPVSEAPAVPLVRVKPDYPSIATAREIEGWVLVRFAIGTDGSVIDPQVVEAEPGRIFESAAIAAIRKWKYRPMLRDGKPVVRNGVTVRLMFKLDG